MQKLSIVDFEIQILYIKSKFIIICTGSAGETYKFLSTKVVKSILSASLDLHISIDETQKESAESPSYRSAQCKNNKIKLIVKDLGQKIYSLIFGGEISDLFNICFGHSLRLNSELNIRIVLGNEFLNLIPWEIMYDGNSFLSHRYNIYRQPFSINPIRRNNTKQNKGKILFIGANPIKDLGVEEAAKVIEEVFNQKGFPGKKLTSPFATYENIANEIFDGTDILHFMAHGEYFKNQEGFNFIIDNADQKQKISRLPLNMFSSFCKAAFIQMVVLDSCRSDQPFDYKEFNKSNLIGSNYKSMAMDLLHSGIPCVIGISALHD